MSLHELADQQCSRLQLPHNYWLMGLSLFLCVTESVCVFDNLTIRANWLILTFP